MDFQSGGKGDQQGRQCHWNRDRHRATPRGLGNDGEPVRVGYGSSAHSLLFGQGGQIVPNLKTQSPTIASIMFLISLVGLEALIAKYWINWRLYQFLPPFLALGLVSAYIGKVALGQEQKARIAAQTGTSTRTAVAAQVIEMEKEVPGKTAKVGIVKTK